MKQKKIVVAGGSGFIGEELIRFFGNAAEGNRLQDRASRA